MIVGQHVFELTDLPCLRQPPICVRRDLAGVPLVR